MFGPGLQIAQERVAPATRLRRQGDLRITGPQHGIDRLACGGCGHKHPVIGVDIQKYRGGKCQRRIRLRAGAGQRQIKVIDTAAGRCAAVAQCQGAGPACGQAQPGGQIGDDGLLPLPHLAPGDLPIQIFIHPDRHFDIAKRHPQVGVYRGPVAGQGQVGPGGFMRLCADRPQQAAQG